MERFLNYFKPLLTIADKDSDSEDIKLQHGFLIYMGLLMSSGGALWGTICLVNDLYLPAIVPFSYIFITSLNFFYLSKTKNFLVSQKIQIFLSLLLPFLFQFLLGGFVASGGNVLWSVIAVFGSFTLRKKEASITWLALFILLVIFSGLVDSEARRFDIGLSESFIIFFFVINFIMTISIIFSLYYYFVSSEEKARKSLNESLEELKKTQERLIASEKMASLGSLVSGVAHEINTPLGVGLTGVSQISHEIKAIEKNYASDTLTEEALLGSVKTIKDLTKTIMERLNNAVNLVKSFKNISIDQHLEDRREFLLQEYIDDLILSLQNPIKSKNILVNNTIDSNIHMNSYSGIFSQIFSNFILNSVLHGFKEESENKIEIYAKVGEKLTISYRDNGSGITDEVQKKIYDPFFTTKRGQGGSGLGMNIVYNLVTQKLGGSINVVRVEPHGLGFDIILDISHIKA